MLIRELSTLNRPGLSPSYMDEMVVAFQNTTISGAHSNDQEELCSDLLRGLARIDQARQDTFAVQPLVVKIKHSCVYLPYNCKYTKALS